MAGMDSARWTPEMIADSGDQCGEEGQAVCGAAGGGKAYMDIQTHFPFRVFRLFRISHAQGMGEEINVPYGAERILSVILRGDITWKENQKEEPISESRLSMQPGNYSARKGYHNTQVSDIIRFVGMSANTFYAHFKDKKELFEEVAMSSIEDLRITVKKKRETISMMM